MSRSWRAIPETERTGIRRRFAVSLAADELAAPEPPPRTGTRPPRFDEIYAAALDPGSALGEPLANALAFDADSREVFESLMRDTAVCWFPAAAAAGGGLDAREEGGFRVWLRPSSVDQEQVYVLVCVARDLDRKPVVLVALPPDGPPVRAALADDVDGVYQLIEREDSPLVRAIRNPDSKLALR